MYVTAMWLRSPRRERGVNVYVHWHPDGLPEDPWKIANDPGPDDRNLRGVGLQPGGNYVEAYLDIALEDDGYELELVVGALRQMPQRMQASTDNPIWLDYPEQAPRVYVRFWLNDLIADPETNRDVYTLLARPIVGLLQRRVPVLPDLATRQATRVRRQQSAGG
jgi:hypothetical protein